MKNLILSILFISVTIIGFTAPSSEQPAERSILVLKGEITGEVNTQIIVFQLDQKSYKWHKTEIQVVKKNYQFILDPQESYQIWFMQEPGHLKILHVQAEDKGTWTTKLDLDFESNSKLFNHMYQYCDEDPSKIEYITDLIIEKEHDSLTEIKKE